MPDYERQCPNCGQGIVVRVEPSQGGVAGEFVYVLAPAAPVTEEVAPMSDPGLPETLASEEGAATEQADEEAAEEQTEDPAEEATETPEQEAAEEPAEVV